MNKLVIVAGGTLVLAPTGLGVGGAVTSTAPSPIPPSVSVSAPNGSEFTASRANENNDTAQESTESTNTEKTGTAKTGASDGIDGGHADPDGVDVNHQCRVNEK